MNKSVSRGEIVLIARRLMRALTVQAVWIFISLLDGTSLSLLFLGFFTALVMKSKINLENVGRGWTVNVRQKSVCQRVSSCTVVSLLAR